MEIRLCTFNVGCGYGDYCAMLKANPEEIDKFNARIISLENDREFNPQPIEDLSQTESEALKAKIEKKLQNDIEKSVAERLIDQTDVICLQEVHQMSRVFIQTLQAGGFHIYPGKNIPVTSDERFSTAIALRESLFDTKHVKEITEKSANLTCCGRRHIFGQEIAAVAAPLKDQQIRLSFASMHSWGFQLYHRPLKDMRDSKSDAAHKELADSYIEQAIELSQQSQADYRIIAGDMNNNPSNYASPFNTVEDADYQILEPSAETNVNYTEPDYKFRKIDYIFAQVETLLQRIWKAIVSIFFTTYSFTVSPAKVLNDFSFTIDSNCSDHLPVGTTITIQSTPSLLSRMTNCFTACLGC